MRDRLDNIAHVVNMELYNHLLWFVCGLYMITATLLNGGFENSSLFIHNRASISTHNLI